MAFSLFNSVSVCTFPGHTQWKRFLNFQNRFHRLNLSSALQCKATTEVFGDVGVVRRSAGYHPPIWGHDYVQSLRSDFLRGESYKERASELRGEVSKMLCEMVDDPLEKLELIDTLRRLGLSRHFEDEISTTLKNVSEYCSSVQGEKQSLHATALGFRLLRQHGFKVNQDVFSSFMDEVGNLKARFSLDCKGLLSLYEGSYLLVEGETMLENARDSAAELLKECRKQNNDQYLSMLVDHALELPLHWRMPRLEARWFIGAYEKNKDKNHIVLELAILDFNMVQAIHQDDLRHASAPQSGKSRRDQTKVNALITVIDDVYDVYGTLDELELFTDAIERWDINAIQKLPAYMKICYHALYNSVNEMAFDTLKEQGIDVLPFLKKVWTNLCKAYLLEAKWYYIGYKPTLQEYIDNAWLSISYEQQRGDVPKSIQCYMHENEAPEEEAREHVKKLIEAAWKKINEEQMAKSPFSRTFIEIAMDLARVSQLMYQNGDGHAIEDGDSKDRVLSLFVHPIPWQ
ncbi:(-)-alpha-terpineol synthase [Hibiscus syriacus]|uniref:(-)-alpha-terpineol synthase n=1 Tax=Hibiscus syriacus TaxID=106335 RepID=A0A6A2YJZ6_HIBSY|nr:(-)-alpha-terpineol synthase [Hibiscus syriacus]